MKKIFIGSVALLCASATVGAFGQDDLPNLNVVPGDGRVTLTWNNLACHGG
ncbi:MAG: hypothetical protein LBJ47_04500 [Tannerella sp.]|jgi:hypothetical protein|nr:hypothetical protein [Tannerella sp.]